MTLKSTLAFLAILTGYYLICFGIGWQLGYYR